MFKGFQKPKRLVANTETLTERYGMFTAQPFQRGFGTTIGNSLRRILSLPKREELVQIQFNEQLIVELYSK